MSPGEEQILRYSRQILLKNAGGAGQEKLLRSRVLIVDIGVAKFLELSEGGQVMFR